MRGFHFLLIVAIVGVTANVIDAEENADESKTVAKIELLGGRITRDDTMSDRPVVGIDFRVNEKIGDGYMRLFRTFSDLKRVEELRKALPGANIFQ